MSRTEIDPNAPAAHDAGLFGLPYSVDEARLLVLPVPWEATTSYGGGTSEGPAAVLAASHQVDLHDLDVHEPWRVPFALAPEPAGVAEWNTQAKAAAALVIEAATGAGDASAESVQNALDTVNALSAKVDAAVEAACDAVLAEGKLLALLGGDHSCPLGAFRALAKHHASFGVLHFDAHADLRIAYEGFERSHASIMHNACELVPQLHKLVQVGVRDVCAQEMEYAAAHTERISVFSDRTLQRSKFQGESWHAICQRIVAQLPQKVWISFDIDGLDPVLCPHTGTPVPGGLQFQEAVYLMRTVVESGRTVLGFDLVEIAPGPDDEWDANVGARLLYKMLALTFASHGEAKLLA